MYYVDAFIFMHLLNDIICMHILDAVLFMQIFDAVVFMHILDAVIHAYITCCNIHSYIRRCIRESKRGSDLVVYMIKQSKGFSGMMCCNERILMHQSTASGAANSLRYGRRCGPWGCPGSPGRVPWGSQGRAQGGPGGPRGLRGHLRTPRGFPGSFP